MKNTQEVDTKDRLFRLFFDFTFFRSANPFEEVTLPSPRGDIRDRLHRDFVLKAHRLIHARLRCRIPCVQRSATLNATILWVLNRLYSS